MCFLRRIRNIKNITIQEKQLDLKIYFFSTVYLLIIFNYDEFVLVDSQNYL